MTLTVSCPCGFSAQVPAARAGSAAACPRCKKSIQVPAPPLTADDGALLAELSRPSLDLEDAPAAGSASSPPPPCVKCGVQYPPESIVCVTCGLSLLTGQPFEPGESEPVRRRAGMVQAEEEDLEKVPFWRIALGLVTAPATTLERFPAWLSRPDFFGKSAGFYAASLLALIAVGLWMANPQRNAASRAALAEFERSARVAHAVPSEWSGVNLLGGPAAEMAARMSQVERQLGAMGHPGAERFSEFREGMEERAQGGVQPPLLWRVTEPRGPVEAGKPFRVEVQAQSVGKQIRVKVRGIRVALADAFGGQPQEEFRAMAPGGENSWTAELTATRIGGTSAVFEFDIEPEGDAGERGAEPWDEGPGMPGRPRTWSTWSHNPGWAEMALQDRPELRAQVSQGSKTGMMIGAAFGTAGATISVLASCIGLMISAGLLTFVARALGGGGGFVPMVVALGLLAALGNILQLVLCVVPVASQPFFSFGISGYIFILQLVALQKVFDIDLLAALLSVVLATAAKFLGAAWIVLSLVSLFGAAR